MPVINIYLSKELFEFVKQNKSKIIKEALLEYKEKLEESPERPCSNSPSLSEPCTLPEPIKKSG